MNPPTDHYQVEVFVDHSGSVQAGTPEEADQLTDYIYHEIAHLDESHDGYRSVTVNIHTIDGYSLSDKTSITLNASEIYLLRDVPKREAEIKAFKARLLLATEQALTRTRSEGGTSIHRAVANVLNHPVSPETHHYVIVISDFIEESQTHSFIQYQTVEELRKNRDEIITQLLADTPLTLNQTNILMLLKTRLEGEAFTYESALLFKDLWQQCGGQVELKRSL